MTNQRKILAATAVALVLGNAITPGAAVADDAGAFLGGVLATKVLGNMKDRTQAEQEQAYYAQQSAQQQQYQQQQPVQQAAPAPAQQTTQQRLDELDKLAAGGYITPAEYKQKKQAILDSM